MVRLNRGRQGPPTASFICHKAVPCHHDACTPDKVFHAPCKDYSLEQKARWEQSGACIIRLHCQIVGHMPCKRDLPHVSCVPLVEAQIDGDHQIAAVLPFATSKTVGSEHQQREAFHRSYQRSASGESQLGAPSTLTSLETLGWHCLFPSNLLPQTHWALH
jgi:hypothetical protein